MRYAIKHKYAAEYVGEPYIDSDGLLWWPCDCDKEDRALFVTKGVVRALIDAFEADGLDEYVLVKVPS